MARRRASASWTPSTVVTSVTGRSLFLRSWWATGRSWLPVGPISGLATPSSFRPEETVGFWCFPAIQMLGTVAFGERDVDLDGLAVRSAPGLLVATTGLGAQHKEVTALARPLVLGAAGCMGDTKPVAVRHVRFPPEC